MPARTSASGMIAVPLRRGLVDGATEFDDGVEAAIVTGAALTDGEAAPPTGAGEATTGAAWAREASVSRGSNRALRRNNIGSSVRGVSWRVNAAFLDGARPPAWAA